PSSDRSNPSAVRAPEEAPSRSGIASGSVESAAAMASNTTTLKTLTLVVTYNEVDNITRLVPTILQHVPTSSVLVVDDNSPDGTAAAVRAIGERDNRVQVICRTNERGYGSAMIAGMRHALANGYEAILTLDADFSHDPA